ncbi:hypothetical protein JR311_20345 (plasmid) [Bacillus velezensis]|uniref:hypothetical protein n=1 Tax=Bacillus velezensis TaxID=492670 RepID=UPI00195D459D|nr:hypothetical protein [Bacillus velezensis]QRV11375.1 hypothetical protein JR311_20345 [Bacillus velezensis]
MAEKRNDQKLAPSKRSWMAVGKAKVNENSFAGLKNSERSDYQYVRINIGIDTGEGNVVYAELMGGYSMGNPIIYSSSKDDGSLLEIPWANRQEKAIVSSVADYRLHKVGLHRDEKGKLDIKTFLSPVDMHDYLKENLKDGMEIAVRGNIKYQEYNGEVQKKYEIQNIFLPFENKDKEGNVLPTTYKAEFTQTILLDESSYKRMTKKDKDNGEVIVSAYAVDYVSKKNGKEYKKNDPFNIGLYVKINEEDPSKTEKILDKLFKVGKGKVREITVEGKIIEGYDQQSVSDKDIELSDEIKELIEMGLYSKEEAKEKMTVRGNKVSKMLFTRPFIQKDQDNPKSLLMDINDTKYTPEDLIVLDEEDVDEALDNESVQEENQDDSSVSEADWMKELGI